MARRNTDHGDGGDREPRSSSRPGGRPASRAPVGRGRGGVRGASRGRVAGPLGPSDAPSDRPAQVGAEIRRALQSELARGLNDPRIQGLVSITGVEVLPDLSEARVRVSVMPEERAPLALSGLRAAAGFLRRRLMDETRIHRVPRLVFEADESIKRQARLDEAIRAGGHAVDGGARAAEASGEVSGEGPDRTASEPENEAR